MVSGRVSFEIVQKAAVAGVPIICAVSAPSSLAIDAAERFGVTLVGFLRGDGFNVYSHDARIDLDDLRQAAGLPAAAPASGAPAVTAASAVLTATACSASPSASFRGPARRRPTAADGVPDRGPRRSRCVAALRRRGRRDALGGPGFRVGAFTLALADLVGPTGELCGPSTATLAPWPTSDPPWRTRFPTTRVTLTAGPTARRPSTCRRSTDSVMANSLHFERDQAAVLARLVPLLVPGGRFILVEYDADEGNRWVPHPVSLARWRRLRPDRGPGGCHGDRPPAQPIPGFDLQRGRASAARLRLTASQPAPSPRFCTNWKPNRPLMQRWPSVTSMSSGEVTLTIALSCTCS